MEIFGAQLYSSQLGARKAKAVEWIQSIIVSNSPEMELYGTLFLSHLEITLVYKHHFSEQPIEHMLTLIIGIIPHAHTNFFSPSPLQNLKQFLTIDPNFIFVNFPTALLRVLL